MNDIFDEIALKFQKHVGDRPIEPLLLFAAGVSPETAKAWLRETYPGGEQVAYARVPTAFGEALVFQLDAGRMTADELITKLNGLGLAVERRKIAGRDAVYVPPQNVAAARAGRWN